MKDTQNNPRGAPPDLISIDQKRIVDFTLNRGEPPSGEYEKNLYDDIQEILLKGRTVELPFE